VQATHTACGARDACTQCVCSGAESPVGNSRHRERDYPGHLTASFLAAPVSSIACIFVRFIVNTVLAVSSRTLPRHRSLSTQAPSPRTAYTPTADATNSPSSLSIAPRAAPLRLRSPHTPSIRHRRHALQSLRRPLHIIHSSQRRVVIVARHE
jgi:hypothetical protein